MLPDRGVGDYPVSSVPDCTVTFGGVRVEACRHLDVTAVVQEVKVGHQGYK